VPPPGATPNGSGSGSALSATTAEPRRPTCGPPRRYRGHLPAPRGPDRCRFRA
jgi:hypothetical protein